MYVPPEYAIAFVGFPEKKIFVMNDGNRRIAPPVRFENF
jgi:hypothetical protein